MSVTKSIRLSEEEAQWVKAVARDEHLSEASVMKRMILKGIEEYRLERAIRAYADREISLSEAARFASLSIRKVMAELEKRGIPLYSSEEAFRSGLGYLAETFGNRKLSEALEGSDRRS